MQHNCKLNNLKAGFEIAKGHWLGHGYEAKSLIDVRQGGLF